jgi:regulator of protease activity HflC (stomatin/prohibitin superfamily)
MKEKSDLTAMQVKTSAAGCPFPGRELKKEVYMHIIYLIFILLVLLILKPLFPYRRITVFEFERGLKYQKGKFIEILEPGQYWCSKVSLSPAQGLNTAGYYRNQNFSETISIKKVDLRPVNATIPGQEVLSSDSISLKISVIARYEVADPYVAINKVQNYTDALYTEIQLAVREIIGSAKIDELLENRALLNGKLLEITAPKAGELGLKLYSASIKDIMFPGELKQIFAQVVKAQKEGLASLEKARGETAALRKLANAARIIEENPSLLYLRLIQSLGESKGNTLVFGMPPEGLPHFRKNGPASGRAPETDGGLETAYNEESGQ